jgi:ubiquinone/menaquinone biosynthesis C-methylase UbiE
MNRFLARQLAHPGPILGPIILAPLWNHRNTALNEAALDALALSPADRVLDVGFGGGYLLQRIATALGSGFAAGVDVSQAMVSYVERRERQLVADGRLILKCGSADQLPFTDGTFSAVCSVNSIFYWRDSGQALQEMRRVAAVGARLVLCFTDKESLSRRGFSAQGLHLFSADEIEAMTQWAGFKMERLEKRSDRHREFWCLTASC